MVIYTVDRINDKTAILLFQADETIVKEIPLNKFQESIKDIYAKEVEPLLIEYKTILEKIGTTAFGLTVDVHSDINQRKDAILSRFISIFNIKNWCELLPTPNIIEP